MTQINNNYGEFEIVLDVTNIHRIEDTYITPDNMYTDQDYYVIQIDRLSIDEGYECFAVQGIVRELHSVPVVVVSRSCDQGGLYEEPPDKS